jgi:hypothetical protein
VHRSPDGGARAIGSTQSQIAFEAFMAAQVAAIEASGLEPEVWIETFAEPFRAAWPAEAVTP